VCGDGAGQHREHRWSRTVGGYALGFEDLDTLAVLARLADELAAGDR
jgi:hypothetical protein